MNNHWQCRGAVAHLLVPGYLSRCEFVYKYEELCYRKVKDLSHKRKGLEIMNKLVDQMDGDLVNEQ